MSRIHEALKKAAQERSTQSASGTTEELLELATSVKRSPSLAEEVSAPPKSEPVAKVRIAPAGFEELIKRCSHPTWQLDPRTNVFLSPGEHKVGAERFRTLRSRLYQIAAAQSLKKIVVTSSIPAEGKTFVAANLAQSIIRQNDRRVLLIDADLRASRLHQTLGAPCTPGLADYLRGEADEYTIIQNGLEGNLCFIPGGSQVSNPSELLLSDRMIHLLEILTPLFDWIILDSPPALPVHDASMLSGLCDGVLFVVRAGQTDFALAEKACSEFKDKNLLGVILNGVDGADAYGHYYYGYSPESDKD